MKKKAKTKAKAEAEAEAEAETRTGSAFSRWSVLAGRIVSAGIRPEEASCPRCGSRTVQCVVAGDTVTRVGYARCWCATCLHGIHVSRVRAAEGCPLHSWADPDAVPDTPLFHEVHP
ncbi:hypothetical protein [Streptomyces sp. NPDC007088]|uniref:hypothetical protein n=1 Tax=Streptomyces sp. NPDC007088 TaxID=3364773 RepID=UPI0036A680B3